MLKAIISACSSSNALSLLQKSNNAPLKLQPSETQKLLDLVGNLQLSHFGTTSAHRSTFSILPDSLVELEKWHPLLRLPGSTGTLFPAQSISHSPNQNTSSSPYAMMSTMTTIYNDPQSRFVLQIFMLPAGCTMPLHDHPGMTVLTKILAGRVDIASYSFKSPVDGQYAASTNQSTMRREVTPYWRQTMTTDSTDTSMGILLPQLGNLHSMRAIESTLFFDILAPPYNPPHSDCTYYRLERTSPDMRVLRGQEAEMDSIHSQWEDVGTSNDRFFTIPFDPSNFACYATEWKGENITLWMQQLFTARW